MMDRLDASVVWSINASKSTLEQAKKIYGPVRWNKYFRRLARNVR